MESLRENLKLQGSKTRRGLEEVNGDNTTLVSFCEAEQKKGGLLDGDMGVGRVF